MSGFLQVWECPKCRERRSTFRMGKSEGRIVPTYCGPSCGMVKVAVERYKPQPSAEERLAAENEALKKEVAGWDESMSLLASEATRVAAELRAELAQARQRIARLESDLIRAEGELAKLEKDRAR